MASSATCTSRAVDWADTIDSCSLVPRGQAKNSIGPLSMAILPPTTTRLFLASIQTSSEGERRLSSGWRSGTAGGGAGSSARAAVASMRIVRTARTDVVKPPQRRRTPRFGAVSGDKSCHMSDAQACGGVVDAEAAVRYHTEPSRPVRIRASPMRFPGTDKPHGHEHDTDAKRQAQAIWEEIRQAGKGSRRHAAGGRRGRVHRTVRRQRGLVRRRGEVEVRCQPRAGEGGRRACRPSHPGDRGRQRIARCASPPAASCPADRTPVAGHAAHDAHRGGDQRLPRRCGVDDRRAGTVALVRGCHLGVGLDGTDASGRWLGRRPARAARQVGAGGTGSARSGRHAVGAVRADGVTLVLRYRSLPMPRTRCRLGPGR